MLPLKLHLIEILLIISQEIFSLNFTKFYSTPVNSSTTFLVDLTSLHTTLPSETTTEKSGNFYETKLNNIETADFYSEGLIITEQNTNVTFLVNVTEIAPKIVNLSTSNENSLNESIIIISLNSTLENITFEFVNDTFKSDYAMAATMTESSGNFWSFRPVDTAAIVAAVFLILGVAGYGGCVIYRRYLQLVSFMINSIYSSTRAGDTQDNLSL